MSDAIPLRRALATAFGERHAVKRLAREIGVSEATAKLYLAGAVPDSRIERLAERALRQLAQRRRALAEAEGEFRRLRAARRREVRAP